ncbi:unnamed protein product [Diatraea saccharalis]|uniref:Uncharacterized protein n=1 Tax=Diatraea saccharalis TaxID=40085 RepID=A0A9N9QST2_9NEOP|nr:unnamed protein product [Diatraea saccharalis]
MLGFGYTKLRTFLSSVRHNHLRLVETWNVNRDEGWHIPPAWDPVISQIKCQSRSHVQLPKDTVSSFCKYQRQQFTFFVGVCFASCSQKRLPKLELVVDYGSQG